MNNPVRKLTRTLDANPNNLDARYALADAYRAREQHDTTNALLLDPLCARALRDTAAPEFRPDEFVGWNGRFITELCLDIGYALNLELPSFELCAVTTSPHQTRAGKRLYLLQSLSTFLAAYLDKPHSAITNSTIDTITHYWPVQRTMHSRRQFQQTVHHLRNIIISEDD